jgi:hypothetical protein
MSDETKVIQKDVWKKFVDEYWEQNDYADFAVKDIKKALGKYLFVELPKDITLETAMKPWFNEMKLLVEKGKAFGGYTWTIDGKTLGRKDY